MALRTIYESFLASPNPLSLSENASLNYITTLTTFTNAGPIVKHLENQNKSVVKIKNSKVIGLVEGQNSLSMDVETTLEFNSGGGAYLPGLENFVTDKIATFPTVRPSSRTIGFVEWSLSVLEAYVLSSTSEANNGVPPESYRPFRSRGQNPQCPYYLGSRCTSQTSGRHWIAREQLANL